MPHNHYRFIIRLFRSLFAVAVFVLTAQAAIGQERSVVGVVMGSDGQPVIGAAVVASPVNATITDVAGAFVISVPADCKELEISSVGFRTAYANIAGRDNVNVVLEVDNVLLEETVVIGYGTTKKGNLSGAVAKVDSEKISGRDNSNVASALQGMLAGVEVRSNSGAPGSDVTISIRGVASVNAESQPLYVVDGIPVDDITGLNPSDIASIEALKDASSAAIYGSRGANGVIIITTKMPDKEQKAKVDVSVSLGVQTLERKVDVMTAEEWIRFRTRFNDANYIEEFPNASITDDYITRYRNKGKLDTQTMNDPRWTMPNYGGLIAVDWQDVFFRPALLQNYQIAVSGNSAKTSYRVSAGYVNQDGIAVSSNYNRLNLQARVQTSMFDDLLTVGFDLKPYISKSSGADVDGKDNAATKVLTMCPLVEPESGIYSGAQPYSSYKWGGSAVSPVAYMENITNTGAQINMVASGFLEARIIEGWKVNVTGSYTYRSVEKHRFIPSSVTSGWASYGDGYRSTGRRNYSRGEKFLAQATTNYDRDFGRHSVSAMAGASLEGSTGSSAGISASQFPNNYLIVFNDKDEVITDAKTTYDMPNRLVSFFGRVQYSYGSRYVLQASLRGDGSSRLGADNRWGIFPAVSGAWRISNEPFWNEESAMNMLKIRASYGVNGNNRISSTAALNLLGSANYSSGGALINGYAPMGVENPGLGWERTTSWNVGFDLGFLDNRILLSAEYYDKLTNDLLYQVSVPATLVVEKYWDNVGSIRNRGVEVEFTSHHIDRKKFRWTTVLNVSYNNNRVESLGDDNSVIYGGYGSQTQVLKVGEPIGSYYLYKAVGVYGTAEDLKYYPVMKQTVVGDVRFLDSNDDGVIDDDDRMIVGKPSPDFTYGMTNRFTFGKWELSFLLTAQTGGSLFSALGRAVDVPKTNQGGNMMSWWENMWVSETELGDGRTPGIRNQNTNEFYTTRWLYSTDFIKIKNLSLSYRFKFRKNSHIKGLKLYINAENLYMWDRYDGGFSPESNNGNLMSAYDYGAYPQARVVSFGANLTL